MKVAFACEEGDAVVIAISHIYDIIRVNNDTCREVQFSISSAFLSELSKEETIFCEDLNAVVLTISYVHITLTIKCYIPGMLKPSITTAFIAKTRQEGQVGVQYLDSIVSTIADIHFVIWADSNSNWAVELKWLIIYLCYQSILRHLHQL